ncbi:MAG: HAD family hydrolase [Roseburia sp.]
MGNCNTVIFDLDGTLLNTLEDLADAVNAALEKHGKPARSIEEIRCFVGNGVRLLIERAVPEGTAVSETDEIFADFKAHYALHCNDKTRPYDGVLEVMQQLKEAGYHLAIVSNKLDSAVKELSEIYFKGLVDVAIGERPGVARKPAADMVESALQELGAEKEHAVYVGDSDVDYATAVNSGLPCISVLWGFRDQEFLEEKGADCFVSDAQSLFLKIKNI